MGRITESKGTSDVWALDPGMMRGRVNGKDLGQMVAWIWDYCHLIASSLVCDREFTFLTDLPLGRDMMTDPQVASGLRPLDS